MKTELATPDLVKRAMGRDRHFRPRQRKLFPKEAEVVATNPSTGFAIGRPGDHFTLEGEGFLPTDAIIGRRGVFLEQPISIDGQRYYIDVKGYGENGRSLYMHNHVSGDLYFGMYLDSVKREYEYPLRLSQQGIRDIQRSVGLFKFARKDFFRYALPGLASVLDSRREFFKYEGRKVMYASERSVSNQLGKAYEQGGDAAVEELVEEYGIQDEMAGFLSGRSVGYIIRAMRSPIRVGDLHDPEIVTSRNRMIAENVGRTTRHMLEKGYWHLSPNPGNWTTEGELVDFEDVIEYPRECHIARADMQRRKIPSIEEYVRFTFGEGTVGLLVREFQTGFMGKKSTEREVVDQTRIILSSLKRKAG